MSIQKVIQSSELEEFTTSGWEVVTSHVVKTKIGLADGEALVIPPTYAGGPHTTQVVPVYREAVGEALLFVMEKDEESVLGEQCATIEVQKKTIAELEANAAAFANCIKGMEENRDRVSASLKSAESGYSEARKLNEKLRERVDVFEGDIAKIRQEIGEAAMKRITGRDK